LDCLTLEVGTDRLSRNVGAELLVYVYSSTFQKSKDFIYSVLEA